MKIQFGALMIATVMLAGCQDPSKTAKTSDATVATSDAKKKCPVVTGSRVGDCHDQGAPEVEGVSGDAYRQGSASRAQSTPVLPF